MNRLAWRSFLPAFLAVFLFSGVVFFYLLPSLDRVVRDQKRLMIRELTESSWNILARFAAEEEAGRLTRDEAQTAAVGQVRSLHYGAESKDYFFIIDEHPRMVAHPYRPDLDGSDLSDFGDPEGNLLFVEMTRVVARDGAGYVHYMWQWKDDPDRIVPKISYVKGFPPWGWIIGTGVYTQDVDAEIAALKSNLQAASLVILAIVAVLLFVLSRAGFRAEKGRRRAAAALRISEEKYRSLVESAGESIVMAIEGEGLYANASLLKLLGYEREEFASQDIAKIIRPTVEELDGGQRHWQDILAGRKAPTRYEAELVRRDGSLLGVMLTLSRIVVQGRPGFMAVATRLAQPRQLDIVEAADPDDLEAASRRTRDLATLMIKHGAAATQVTHMLSEGADGAVRKAVEFITAEIGPPPLSYEILLMGSLGRSEVSLLADQDHAILYPDVPADQEAVAQKYFLRLGSMLSDLLYEAGYPYCMGGIMSGEPACCRSLGGWKRAFDGWIHTPEPEALLHAKIFFDFRGVLGNAPLVGDLQRHLHESLARHQRFFPILAHSILAYEPPLKAFGGIAVQNVDGARRGFDIKGVQAQIVDVARLRALQHGVTATGTLERLEALGAGGHLREETVEETSDSYLTLLELRLRHQARRRADQLEVDNIIDPETLDEAQRGRVKAAFQQIKALQDSLQLEFGARQ